MSWRGTVGIPENLLVPGSIGYVHQCLSEAVGAWAATERRVASLMALTGESAEACRPIAAAGGDAAVSEAMRGTPLAALAQSLGLAALVKRGRPRGILGNRAGRPARPRGKS